VVFRLLRLVAVASIFAFGLTARTATATYAQSPQPAAYPPPGAVDPPPIDLGGQSVDDPPPVDPPPVEPPPTDPPPTDPPTDPVDPPPTEGPPTDAPPSEPPPIVVVPPPPDPGPSPVGVPPTDPPIAQELPPPAPDAPPPSDPPLPDPTAPPVPDPGPIVDAQADSDPPAAEPIPPIPVDLPLPAAVSHLAKDSAPAATPPRPAVVRETISIAVAPVVPAARGAETPRSVVPGGLPHIGLTLSTGLEPMAAGIAAGVAVANRTPATVAVAIEFGRVGGGWAGAIVFNLWLGRQMRMRRMSQRQLAALSGVDHSTISRLLLHDRRPSLATATKLAKALRQVEGESDTADYFERVPEETLFPARRVEMALRADELLDDDEVSHVMSIYLDARRRRLAASRGGPVQVRQSTRAP
jgi:transcriptional regulator with XRE-family HTH domain